MTKAQISKHLRVVLQKMFENTGIEYSDEYVQTEGWYLRYKWKESERKDFIKWLSEYLQENEEAREELLMGESKEKVVCNVAAKQIATFFGWTSDDSN